MTYKELGKKISTLSNAYGKYIHTSNCDECVSIMIDEQIYAIVTNRISSCFSLSHFVWEELEENLRHDLLEVLHEFAQTPVDARYLVPRFYISSKLTQDDDYGFLFKDDGNIDSLGWGRKDGGYTEFTQEEIDYICDKFHTDLNDFNIEEVKE